MSVALTRKQVRRVDQLAQEQLGFNGLVLMENAGRNAADLIRRRFGRSSCAVVLCGTGNNGGDGCVIARHLANTGWSVRVAVVGKAARMSGDMRANFNILAAMGLDPVVTDDPDKLRGLIDGLDCDDVVIDALLGTGFCGILRNPVAQLIDELNEARKHAVVAVDIPSGLDCDTGKPSPVAVRAAVTITFVARKIGFDAPGAREFLGEVCVADIGVPPSLITQVRERF